MIWVDTDYMGEEAWAKVDWEAVRRHWPGQVEAEKPANQYGYALRGPVRLSYEEAAALAESGLSLKLVACPNAMLTKMQDQRRWSYGEGVQPRDLMSGAAVQITVPDLALMCLNEVTWLDDACTQEVQRHLDEGWRIIAVCPPNAARRPDYILGRRRVAD